MPQSILVLAIAAQTAALSQNWLKLPDIDINPATFTFTRRDAATGAALTAAVPVAERLPVQGPVTSQLVTDGWLGREITLEGRLDPDAFWPHSDTIGGSRWVGQMGGPTRTR